MATLERVGPLRNFAFVSELALIVGMAVTLVVTPQLDNILPWYYITIPLYIRAAFWIVGLSILPGFYLLRILGILSAQDAAIRFGTSSILSMAMVGAVTMIFYSLSQNLLFLPAVLLAVVVVLALASWRIGGFLNFTLPSRLTKSQALLALAAAMSILVAALVQSNWRYVIYTDNWISLLAGVKLVFGRDVYSAYLSTNYPVAFGFIIAGFSSGAGMPIVNTQALMLPLVALNVLVFYALVKIVFGLSGRIAALASVFLGFSEGLGWIYNLVNHGSMPYVYLSGFLKDMYFLPPFWNQISFQYKLVALLMAFMSLALFSLSGRMRGKDDRKGIYMVILSAFLFVWAFLIHMLPAFLAPMFIAIAIFSADSRFYIKRLMLLVISGVVLLVTHDLLMGGIYMSLIMAKIGELISGIGSGRLLLYGIVAAGALGSIVVGYIGYQYISRHHHSTPATDAPSKPPTRTRDLIKYSVIIGLAAIYLAGLAFVPGSLFTLDPNATFPWYLYVTRYGFLGALAFFGLAFANWRSNWFKIAAVWSLVAIVGGSIWWGERLNAFLFPMIALLASVGAISTIKRAYPRILDLRSKISIGNIKWLAGAISVIVLIFLSFGSLVYGVQWHMTTPNLEPDGMMLAFNWIGHNIPANESILADNFPTTPYYGIFSLADHHVYMNNVTSSNPSTNDPVAQMEAFQAKNVKWALVNDSLPGPSGSTEFLRGIQYYSKTDMKSGSFSVREVPQFKLPSDFGEVAVVNKTFLGVSQLKNSFGWVDDSMSNWVVGNAQKKGDGEVLTLTWSLLSNSSVYSYAYSDIPAISTSAYQYVIIHYRNTANATTLAQANLTQAIRFESATSSFVGYVPLPASESYQVLFYQLRAGVTVGRIGVVTGYNKGLNGTLGLEIDYIGLATAPPAYNPVNPGFLSTVVPSFWSRNYTINSDFNIGTAPSILVTTYDRNIQDEISSLPSAQTVILFNTQLFQPSWGEGWSSVASGVISGTFQGKRVIIVDAGAQQIVGNLDSFSQWLFNQTT